MNWSPLSSSLFIYFIYSHSHFGGETYDYNMSMTCFFEEGRGVPAEHQTTFKKQQLKRQKQVDMV